MNKMIRKSVQAMTAYVPGEQPKDDDIVKWLVMVHIGGNHQHHRSGGKSYDESEVGDVESP